MKKAIVLLLVTALVIATVSPAMAAKKMKPKKNFVFKGSVVEVGSDDLTVEIEGGNRAAKKYIGDEVVFKVTGKTDIRIEGDEADLEDIEEDDEVEVIAKGRSGDTIFKAKKIFVREDHDGDHGGPGGNKPQPPPGGGVPGGYNPDPRS